MFMDLVKARKGGAMSEREREEEVSPDRIRELMDELFSGSSDEGEEDEMDKGSMSSAQSRMYQNNNLYKMDGEEDDGEDFEDMEKAEEEDEEGEEDERREMMDKVYSMIDDLSDEELTRIIESRTMKKALAMNVVNTMSNQALSEFVSQMEANGEQGMSELEKGAEMMEEGEEDLEKGESCDF